MDDDAKKQMRAILVVIAVVVGIGAAVFSGVHSLGESKPHVVGSLGSNLQGTPPPTAAQAAGTPAASSGGAPSKD